MMVVRSLIPVGALTLILMSATSPGALAQGGRGAGPGQPAQTGRAGAPVDLTGYWVAIVNEDWRWRMVTPPAKDYASVPLNAEARKIADSWDVSKDGSCLAYGAAGLMRMPTRLHITWENDNTLKIDTDYGQQTRRLVFGATAAPGERSLQGFSAATWERPGRAGGAGGFGGGGFGGPPPGGAGGPGGVGGPPPAGGPGGFGPPPAGGPGGRGAPPAAGAPRGGGAPQPPRGGNLKVTTTQLSPGWLRRNGVPYSENTTLTEYYDRFTTPGGDVWFVVTTIVDDPKYLTQPFVTSSHFRQEPDAAKWDPTACKP